MSNDLLVQIISGKAPGLMPLNVDQYEQMAASGILPEGSPVELLDGLIVCKDRRDGSDGGSTHGSLHGPMHAMVVTALHTNLGPLVQPFGMHVRAQLPIHLEPNHQPEPDIAIIIGDNRNYATALPTADQTSVVIEVADSSLTFDRGTKQRICADAGIPTYAIVDLPSRTIEVYQQPHVGHGIYRHKETFAEDQTVTLYLPGGDSVNFDVGGVLP